MINFSIILQPTLRFIVRFLPLKFSEEYFFTSLNLIEISKVDDGG